VPTNLFLALSGFKINVFNGKQRAPQENKSLKK
jgi:hypothetical protein